MLFFFFSSRRRHTRCGRDWSSDVCSSDLTSIPKVNGRAFVTGAHKYTYDMKRPGMLWAKVLYPPQFEATLKSLDASAAEAIAGAKVVREGNFVAVAAPVPDMWGQALAALKAEWNPAIAEADIRSVYQYD